jgi:16S rRNA (uracil1498-N3)-methyltransferase
MNRFFISQSDIRGDEVVLGGEQAHQIRNVLRIKPSERIIVLDNTGFEYEVIITDVGKEKTVGRIESRRAGAAEPQVRLILYQSLLARDKFELVLQKCTEVGVSQFVPVITQRSLVRDADAVTSKKLTRWRRIITEAAEQSHRSRIPDLSLPVQFEEALSQWNAFDRCLIASPQEQQMSMQKALSGGKQNPQTIALLIGPEGGFAEQEVSLAVEAGAKPVSLGPRILRTETAAIVAAALILHELEQA